MCKEFRSPLCLLTPTLERGSLAPADDHWRVYFERNR
jgi:hypothetical protein